MKTWIEPQSSPLPETLPALTGGSFLVAQILARRGFSDPHAARAFIDPGYYEPAPAADLPDMDRAVERLERALANQEKICVWGDFDVDGQTATSLLVSLLRSLGADPAYHIPLRSQGHGVHTDQLAQLIDEGIDVLLTCDTGVAAHDAIAYANQHGVDVVVTDHHDLPQTLPDAYAIVNPKRLSAGHPLASLPGVGVAYKLAEALLDRFGHPGEAEQFLDLVALGIVADVALQVDDTRFLLQQGLESLRGTRRIGLQVLMEKADLNPAGLSEQHIGFAIGPRLNALGRLDDANLAVDFLLTEDQGKATLLATRLEGLNARRKFLTDQVFEGAQAQIEQDPELLEQPVLVLEDADWPASIIGIVASRLVERYNRPTILIANPEEELARGSARSIKGFDISRAIAGQSELLHSYGGHPMAAGMSLDRGNIDAFRRRINQKATEILGDQPVEATLQIDAYLPLADISLELVDDLAHLAPFGAGNPPVVLASRDLRLLSQAPIGRNKEHLQLTVTDDQGNVQRVLWWQGAGRPQPEGVFDLACLARSNSYRGQRQLQIEWLDFRPVAAATLEPQPVSDVTVMDHRHHSHPEALLQKMSEAGSFQVWAEGEARRMIGGTGRFELVPGKDLAIWTIPPGRQVLLDVLERIQPDSVAIFGIDPGLDEPVVFLKRLAGLVHRTLNVEHGQADLPRMASAMAHRIETVQVGLGWLEARGDVQIKQKSPEGMLLEKGEGQPSEDAKKIYHELQEILAEAAAYREFFVTARADNLL
ncbi:MAG: single-stranded-DNA-specific exonuclease RecJ [Chloroflexota bacterium]|nr:single-stranded-DNA-specific exonuclease RecJ [Chloroflexota bacterium]